MAFGIGKVVRICTYRVPDESVGVRYSELATMYKGFKPMSSLINDPIDLELPPLGIICVDCHNVQRRLDTRHRH